MNRFGGMRLNWDWRKGELRMRYDPNHPEELHPPGLAVWILERTIHPDIRERVLADLHEMFQTISRNAGRIRALAWYWKQTIQSLPKLGFDFTIWRITMHWLEIKMMWRRMFRQKGLTVINLSGLALGFMLAVLLYAFIESERRFDAFHVNGPRLFRVNTEFNHQGEIHKQAFTQAPLGPALKMEQSSVSGFARFLDWDGLVEANDAVFNETVLFTDPDFFSMFTFPLIAGDPDRVFADPNSVVLSRKAAEKYFGQSHPAGEIMRIKISDRFYDFKVTGVVDDAPVESSIQFQILIPFQKLRDVVGESYFSNWGIFSLVTYLQLEENASASSLQSVLPDFIARHVPENSAVYRLQSLDQIHWAHDVSAGLSTPSRRSFSVILGSIGMLILLVAAVNFSNLSMAKASVRMGEMGIRKTLGAVRTRLMKQFWGESLFYSAAAFTLGLVAASLALPVFSGLMNRPLALAGLLTGSNLLVLTGLVGLVGMLAGAYPALALSRFHIVDSLKKQVRFGGGSRFTRTLIVVQFSISIGLAIATGIVFRQVQFMQTKSVGTAPDAILVLHPSESMERGDVDALRNALSSDSRILGISGVNAYPGSMHNGTVIRDGDTQHQVQVARIDPDFPALMNLVLSQGRSFSEIRPADLTSAILVNETLYRNLGAPDITQKSLIMKWGGMNQVRIIGVLKDFHTGSLHESIGPLVYYANPEIASRYVLIRYQPNETTSILKAVQTRWDRLMPDEPFVYTFWRDDVRNLYEDERRWNLVFRYSSIMALAIAAVGLLGLSALLMLRRTKEIGIRKVLGASVRDIVAMLSKDFLGLLVAANVLAWPVIFWAMSNWLERFAYRIQLWSQADVFVMSGLFVVGIALCTVMLIAWRAARQQPIRALRSE